MARTYLWQMSVLLELLPYMVALNGTEQCQICQPPLTQNPLVPWLSDLKDTTEYFSGLRFKVMRVLLGNSFVSAPMIQVFHKIMYIDAENCGLRMRRECRKPFRHQPLQRQALVSDPGMHHGTCVTLTRGGGKTFPAFPAHVQPAILRIW